MLLPKISILLYILVVLQETAAVRGALFRSGRAVPFERVVGQQDFLRFGRAGMASGVGGGSEGGPDDVKNSYIRVNGEPEIVYQ
ncbi:VVGQQDFLRF-amide [Caenorhabditis elegans]|uniref:FMRFamide-like neuropeptide 23 n=1 Tax=Caenorhabditis elegans TaxID=6239 RepID=FLP23_CAEEL|nr:VVGQQDFLRF-amide [Caenorhabditis elegans]P34405.3 RecName: Full=FMRFamide-like neuropeptide 23; Contains: RecName: Full=VVGQQDFLRF-amide; Flags: Precursor [Caenorhabditis elegans]AAY18633.1 FMRFamide-related peptide 23 precursor [Caenorhabditis elegans]CCD62141.2 VVGQQDFLRF-amide [Caenorhabditis elegans]|eukprot:NP_498907.3 VVGQQDFLRF-amide [Caenorhabditis elegans]